MRAVAIFVVVTLCCLMETGCGFKTYRPGQLYSSGLAMHGCVITRLDGIVYQSGRGITLLQPDDKYNSITLAVKNGYPILNKGSKVYLIDLSSQWDSVVGRFIMAKAKVPSLENKTYLFRIYYVINRIPDKYDFEAFLKKGFAPCK